MIKKFSRIIPFSMLVLVFMALIVIAPTDFAPRISFVEPTPPSGTTTSNTNVEINVSVEDASLTNLIYNWNGNNYSFYDSSLVLMFNFDNMPTLGENYGVGCGLVKDISGKENNGYLGDTSCNQGRVPEWMSDGRYGGAFEFRGDGQTNGIGQTILVPHSSILNPDSGDFAIIFWANIYYNLDGDFLRKGSTNTASTWYKVEVSPSGAGDNKISLNFNTDGTDATITTAETYHYAG